ncbi:MAG: aldehyde dehydrogenase family protein [Ilumatobacteraceae bacterium]
MARSTAGDIESRFDAAHHAADSWSHERHRAEHPLRIADRMEQQSRGPAVIETWTTASRWPADPAADLAARRRPASATSPAAAAGSRREPSAVIDADTVAYHFHRAARGGRSDPVELPAADGHVSLPRAHGNWVVLKPAGATPTSILPIELVGDLLPDGVLNVVNGFGVEAGKPLAPSKRTAIVLTGETTTGRLDHAVRAGEPDPRDARAGRQRARNIFMADVMDADDDFDKVVEGFRMFAPGPGRGARPSRALIQASIYDRFIEKAIARTKQIVSGDPLDPATMIGAGLERAVREDHVVHRHRHGRRAPRCHRWLPRAVDGRNGGFYVEPTILKGHNGMRIFQRRSSGRWCR